MIVLRIIDYVETDKNQFIFSLSVWVYLISLGHNQAYPEPRSFRYSPTTLRNIQLTAQPKQNICVWLDVTYGFKSSI